MANKIIPDSHENRLNFLTTFKTELNSNAVTLALDVTFLAAMNVILTALIAKYQALVDAELAATEASADAAVEFDKNSDALHALFNNLKANPNCTPSMRVAMGIDAQTTNKPAAQVKPKIKVVAQAGHVRVSGSKDYAELVNIYMRVAGTTQWRLVGIHRKKLPFDDQTPLAVAGVAETREYQATGVIGDDEVGQPSDIVQVTFAG